MSKIQRPKSLGGKIQIIYETLQCKIETPQTLGSKIQILKFQDVKSKYSQTLRV